MLLEYVEQKRKLNFFLRKNLRKYLKILLFLSKYRYLNSVDFKPKLVKSEKSLSTVVQQKESQIIDNQSTVHR